VICDPAHFRFTAAAIVAALFPRGQPIPPDWAAELAAWHDCDPDIYHHVAGVEPADCPHCPEETT
jgi:hypothetical protein